MCVRVGPITNTDGLFPTTASVRSVKESSLFHVDSLHWFRLESTGEIANLKTAKNEESFKAGWQFKIQSFIHTASIDAEQQNTAGAVVLLANPNGLAALFWTQGFSNMARSAEISVTHSLCSRISLKLFGSKSPINIAVKLYKEFHSRNPNLINDRKPKLYASLYISFL